MNQPAVQDKRGCWICFNNENNITLTTVDSERTLKSCETYLDISIIIKRFEKENQVSCCRSCFESTRQLISLEEQVQKLQQEISEVSSGFSKNVLQRRSRLQNEIKNASNSVSPTEKCFKILNYRDRPSFEMIENVTVKEEVNETASTELPADFQGNTKRDDSAVTAVSDPWFETLTYETDNVNKEECESAFDSEDSIEIKYSYDEIISREVDSSDEEIATNQTVSETNSEENERAETTSMARANYVKMPNIDLKRLLCDTSRSFAKTVAVVEENFKCEKSLDDSSEPNNHSETLCEERPFKCREIACSKSFKRKSDLVVHHRIHSEEKPYKCSSCSKSFRRSQDLKNHNRIHSGEKQYKCNICEKSFSRSSILRVHETIHSKKKPYKCSSCEKTYRRQQALKDHERLHTGKRICKCSFCSKSFLRSSELKMHERIHTGERPYKWLVDNTQFGFGIRATLPDGQSRQ